MDPARSAGFGPIWSALQGDAAELEIRMAGLQMWVGGFALAIAVYFTVLVDSPIGPPLAAFAGWVVVWFGVARFGMRRGWALRIFGWLNPLVEILIPGVCLLLLARLQGPEYALGSWVPAQMFALFTVASILRLRPWVPLAMGIVAAVEYGLVYQIELRAAIGPDDVLWAQPRVQLVRMFTLVLFGVAGTSAVFGFRRMILRAEGEVRSRELFGKYRLGERIASGGMGTVYEAVYCPEGGFQRPVAIKQIHPHLARDEAFVARFRHEAELCSRLAHPNIVAALDFGRVEDTYFFAMEFIDGVTLKDVPLRAPQAGGRARAPGRVLAAPPGGGRARLCPRRRGRWRRELMRVVHRDMSPHNVLLDRSGQVKISDFGVARALGDAHDLNTGNLAGKPAYMAPEQLRKSGIDARSDLWGVGVMAWEALTNRRLFFRDNDAATMLAVLEDPVLPPSTTRPVVGVHWDRFCVRALARDADHRFQTAAGMLANLDAIQEIEGRAGAAQVMDLIDRLAEWKEASVGQDRAVP